MKITGAHVIVCCPGRNFVTLEIETDEGLVGLGDATLNGRELAVASYLADHVIPCLIGRDPHQIEDVMARELKKIKEEELHPSHAIQAIADALPALGIVAAKLVEILAATGQCYDAGAGRNGRARAENQQRGKRGHTQ